MTDDVAETRPERASANGARSGRRPLVPLIVLLSATFMSILDAFIVNVAVPSIQADLGASSSDIQLVVAIQFLCYAAGLMVGGRLGDRFGYRTVFRFGVAVFTFASVACGLAPSITVLLIARAAQGLGAAMMVPQVLTLLPGISTGQHREWAFRGYGLALGLASGAGQVVGGALIELDAFGLGWRTCFLINAPIGLVCLVAARRTIPPSEPRSDAPIDVIGAVFGTVAMMTLVLPLIEGRARGWPPWTWASLAVSAVLLVAFVRHSRRADGDGRPSLVSWRLLTNRRLLVGLAAVFVFFNGSASFFLVTSLYLQQGRGLDPLAAGLVFSVMVAGFLLTTLGGGRMTSLLGRRSMTVGAVATAIGHLAMRAAIVDSGPDGPLPVLFVAMVVTGAGIGLVMAPLVSCVLADIAPGDAGTASGLVSSAQQLGNASGIALIGLVYFPIAGNSRGADVVDAMAASQLYLFLITLPVVALLGWLQSRPTLSGSRFGP